MKHTTRGAAKVSAVWLIALLVLFFVSVAFAFIAQGEKTDAEILRDSALASKLAAEQEQEAHLQRLEDVARVLGFFDAEQTGFKSADLTAAKNALSDITSAFALAASVDTYEELLPDVRAARQKLIDEIQTLNTAITRRDSEVKSAQEEAATVQRDKDVKIAELTQRIDDEVATATTRQSQLEEQRQRLSDQVAATDKELRGVRLELEAEKRKREVDRRGFEARTQQLVADQAPFKEPYSLLTDARVLESTPKLQLGWIDIGAKHRLALGTVFDVYAGGPSQGDYGHGRFKGQAEVTRTDPEKAQVRFLNIADQYDPIVAGDHLVNRLYDPRVEHNAVLVGSFYGEYNAKELGLMLERIGIHVQDAPDITTHYVIVGNDVYTDEDGEPLEEPLKPSDLPAYRDAEAQGAVVIPLAELKAYFKL